MILVLSIILFLLLAFINKKRGVKAFISLYINFIFLTIAVGLIVLGFNPIIISLIFSFGTSAFILFFINGINKKTKIAYLSVIITLILMSAFIIFIGYRSNMHGFIIEHTDVLHAYSMNIQINYLYIFMAMMIMMLVGALTNTALDIATSVNEIIENTPDIGMKDLIKSANNIGSDIIGTTINTLLFVFISIFIGFYFFYSQFLGFAYLINHKMFMQEISYFIIVVIGSILIIPIVIYIQSFLYLKRKE